MVWAIVFSGKGTLFTTGAGAPGFLAMSEKEGAFLVSFGPTTFHSSGEEAPEF